MEPTTAAALRFKYINLSQLKPNPWNRTVFDPQLMDELVANIKSVGIRDPLLVRPLAQGQYEIASGQRRWLAAQKAGLTEVPCWIQNLQDEDVAIDNITLNVQRENLPPLELARMLSDFMVKHKKSQRDTAALFGKTEAWVSQYQSYLSIHPDLKNLTAVKFSTGDLRALKQIPPDHQQQVAKELKDDSLKTDQVQKRCKQLRSEKEERHSIEGIIPQGLSANDVVAEASPRAINASNAATRANGQGVIGQLLTTGKSQAAQYVLAPLGEMGRVLEKAKGLKTWQVALLIPVAYMTWRLCLFAMNWPVRLAEHAWNRTFRQSSAWGSYNTASHPLSPRQLQGEGDPSSGSPVITKVGYAEGHKIRLEWKPLGPGYRYKVVYAYPSDNPSFDSVSHEAVETPGALVNVYNGGPGNKALLAVRGIAPDHSETGLSAPVEVTLNESNNQFAVHPLPEVGSNELPPSALPAPASAVPVPAGFRAEMVSPNVARLSWMDAGPDYGYRIYSGRWPDLSDRFPENEKPLKLTTIRWRPHEGTGDFWLSVSAVNAQGQESAMATPVKVTVR